MIKSINKFHNVVHAMVLLIIKNQVLFIVGSSCHIIDMFMIKYTNDMLRIFMKGKIKLLWFFCEVSK
jgi:hypothetical protein